MDKEETHKERVLTDEEARILVRDKLGTYDEHEENTLRSKKLTEEQIESLLKAVSPSELRG